MPTQLSQVIYGFVGDAKPILMGEGDNAQKVVNYDDYSVALSSVEEAMGQVIIQNNSETDRLQGIIDDAGLIILDPGTATLAQTVAQQNAIIAVLTNLNSQSKE